VALLYPHRLSAATVADLYQIADALLFPSTQEGFGIPLIEAGLARLPVFCSDLPPFREIAGDRVHYFAPDANPSDLARRLLEFFASDPAARLRRRVRQEYTWEALFPRLIEPLVT
jgi:glycosyltransferase involved in cell wall biosynthesis